jgi:biotin transport system substrate-specific component
MNIGATVGRYVEARHRFYLWRNELDYARMTALALAFACLTGLGALIRIYTPLSPVPFTAQVFFVLMSGAVLGSRWGGMSQALYVGIGLMGMPWFAGGAGGVEVLYGPTAGYLFGFIAASSFIGWMTERHPRSRQFRYNLPTMLLGVGLIYAFGVPVLALGAGMGLAEAVLAGGGIFLAFDIVKAAMASAASKAVLDKEVA